MNVFNHDNLARKRLKEFRTALKTTHPLLRMHKACCHILAQPENYFVGYFWEARWKGCGAVLGNDGLSGHDSSLSRWCSDWTEYNDHPKPVWSLRWTHRHEKSEDSTSLQIPMRIMPEFLWPLVQHFDVIYFDDDLHCTVHVLLCRADLGDHTLWCRYTGGVCMSLAPNLIK